MDWFSRYLKNRDLVFRKIAKLTEEDDRVITEMKDGKKTVYLVDPFPEDIVKSADFNPGEGAAMKGLVIYHTKENFDNIVKSWDTLAGITGLTIFSLNPYSTLDKKWIINPRTHALVSDADSLKEGLKAMFETVEPITREKIEKITSG